MKDFWIKRWEDRNTPWHQEQPETLLIHHFPKNSKRNVLVPLCGKSLDMLWLAGQGSRVLGSEMSPIASETFFVENQIPFQARKKNNFRVFKGSNIAIYCGDFFELSSKELGKVDFIYDRAALIALSEDIRTDYADRVKQIAKASSFWTRFEMLIIGRETLGPPKEGPPFMIGAAKVENLYADTFKIEVLETKKGPARKDIPEGFTETAYRLVLK